MPRPPAPPAPLVLSSLLLSVSALALFVYCAVTVAAIDDIDRIALETYGVDYQRDWRSVALGVGWLTVGSLGLLALLLLLFALLNARGSRGARAWTFVLGCLTLFCCGPCWWFSSLDSLNADPTAVRYEFTQRLSAELDWYGPLASRSVVIALGALMIALMLLMLPPTNRYFRSLRPLPRPVYYYPYHPYYPYPPRR